MSPSPSEAMQSFSLMALGRTSWQNHGAIPSVSSLTQGAMAPEAGPISCAHPPPPPCGQERPRELLRVRGRRGNWAWPAWRLKAQAETQRGPLELERPLRSRRRHRAETRPRGRRSCRASPAYLRRLDKEKHINGHRRKGFSHSGLCPH